MSDSPSEHPDPQLPLGEASLRPGDLEQLQELLFGREKEKIVHLQERLENPALHAQDVGRVLPQAVAFAGAQDDQLARALTPTVEAALKDSVRRNPGVLADAIFPVLGPAIRKAIAETFSKLVQSLNQTLEHSLSVQGLKWRLEAARTGKSFAEVVLAHTLVYRVEQVFLIHRETSLLLQHVNAAHVAPQDADLVSGMLSAIQDFARDSFQVAGGEALETLRVGELNVWVETGPRATLAAVIRGAAPEDFHAMLQNALERIHAEQGVALEAFDGNAAPFAAARVHLENCLLVQFGGPAQQSSAKLWIGASLGVFALLVWLFFAVRESRRWNDYLQILKAQEGIVVTEATRSWEKFRVEGLRDPLAAEPQALLARTKLNTNKITSRWEAYQALSPGLVRARAERRLAPPPGVSLRFEDGVLYAEGFAPRGWAETARRTAEFLPGVQQFNTERLLDRAAATVAARQSEIERTVLLFDDGPRLMPGQEATVNALAAQILELRQATAASGQRLRLVVLGHTDKTGQEDYNLRLSRQRAEQVAALLAAKGVPAALLSVNGVGSREPRRAGAPESEQALARRATFRVLLEEGTP